MPDRVVYLVSTLPRKASESQLEFVDDSGLGQLLSDGWETSTTLPERTLKVAGKSIKATMMVLKRAAENRGMTMRDDQPHERRAGGTMVTLTDDFGDPQQMNPGHALVQVMDKMSRALANLGDTGHLGGARNHNMPGLQIVSGEMVQKAFDCGLMAYRRGESVDSCPFPPKSEARQTWLRGFRLGEKNPPQEIDATSQEECYQAGFSTAKEFGADDEVTCPFPAGSFKRTHWLRGFKAGGGRVEDG